MTALLIKYDASGEPFGYACSDCGTAWANASFGGLPDAAKTAAHACCNEKVCTACGKLTDRNRVHLLCKPCEAARDAATEEAQFEKATKVRLDEYSGDMVYADGIGDGYILTDDLVDKLEEFDIGEDRRAYVYGTLPAHAKFDLEDALGSYLSDEHHEDAMDSADLSKTASAHALIDEALKTVTSDFAGTRAPDLW